MMNPDKLWIQAPGTLSLGRATLRFQHQPNMHRQVVAKRRIVNAEREQAAFAITCKRI
jgi:hypothetical protein